MTTENHELNQSESSSLTNVDSSSKMQGWIKLAETLRKSGTPSNESIRRFPNSNLNNNPINNISTRQQNLFEKSLPITINTNGHILRSSETINTTNTLDSPPNIFTSPSIISIASTPRETIQEISLIEIEPTLTPRLTRESIPLIEMKSTPATTSSSSPSTDSIQSEKRPPRKMTSRKLNKFKEPTTITRPIEISTPITEDISDDDMPLIDIRRHKTKSIDTLSMPSVADSIIPLATDLQSLPGHSQDENRDIRFLNYNDTDTLALHLNACLYVNKNSLLLTNENILEARYNVLNKIFRIYYLKTFRKNIHFEKKNFFNKKDNHKQQPLSVISSPTSTSFKTDWSVNRRNSSSTHRHIPKNIFHILQQQPKNNFTMSNNPSSSKSKTLIQNFECIKDILARTYYPHLYTAVEYGYQFGFKSNFPNTQQLISTCNNLTPVKQMPESPSLLDASVTITLKSPPSTTRQDSTIQQQSSIIKTTNDNKPLSIPVERCISEEIEELSPLVIKESIVVLTPTKIPIPSPPLTDKDKKLNNNRKRKPSPITNTNSIEKKKKRIVSSASTESIKHIEKKKKRIVSSASTESIKHIERKKRPILSSSSTEFVNHIEDISDPESDEDVLRSQLPRQYVTRNVLRSNYNKTSTDHESKSVSHKNRNESRRRQSSGSLPSFYAGMIESDDNDKSPHIDYCPPYDIDSFDQQKAKQATVNNSCSSLLSSSISTFQPKKKKSSQPKQKQPSPYKKISRNVYSDQLRQNLLSSYTSEKAPVCDCKSPATCEDGVCMNRFIFTECLPTCACGNKCSNQKIRKGQWSKHLEVFDTSKYGQGLRSTSSISKGTFLCEYVGEIITDDKFHERMTNIYSKDEHHYTMKLTQNLVIDAYRMGSIARLANHSCSPNCEFQKWTVDGLQRMCMFSLRTIKAGEELTYDYNFQCFNLQAQQPCYCESSKCRGTIGTKQATTTINNNHHSTTSQKLTQREKGMVLQTSIFLLRNLKRIKQKQESKKKKTNKLKQSTDKQSAISLFFAQNYYHSNGSNNKSTLVSLRKSPKLNHKDIFYLFYNHIRRSHFAKSGRYQYELIDKTCYYAQLAQFTLILNEIFDLVLNYKCINENITPSDVLKKCPLKRLFPQYYERITKPIDLTMIKNKLDNGEYSSFHLFEKDFSLLFKNAITYCGEDSDEAQAVLELQDHFFHTLEKEYPDKLNLFINMKEDNRNLTNLNTLENFITNLHEKEVLDGQIRSILYDIIYNIDDNSNDTSPIVYKIVLANNLSSHRLTRSKPTTEYIVHCRCGSVYDESSLVQCYACQLWQHVACVSIIDPSQPYYCFECQPACENNPSACLKINVLITGTLSPLQTYDDNHCSYSTLTRSDGFIIRINECYFVPKQEENNIDRSLQSPEYDILCIERLWIDDYGVGQASGYYYIRPNETFHEPNRKFFPNEVFRFPPSNDPLPISSIVRPCFVLDMKNYSKGKPISDNSFRVLLNDIFICEYRVDKAARTFTRLIKSRQFVTNTKSYCFDNYVEKLVLKRDYQPYQKEVHQQNNHDHRRRSTINPTKLNNKKFKEKNTRINGFIEKIYCCRHDQTSIPNDAKYTIDQLLQQTSSVVVDDNNHNLSLSSSFSSPLQSPAGNITKKRHTISISSDDDVIELVPETECQRISKKRLAKQKIVSLNKRDELIDQI